MKYFALLILPLAGELSLAHRQGSVLPATALASELPSPAAKDVGAGLDTTGQDEVEADLEGVEELLASEQHSEALRHLDRILGRDPGNDRARFLKGYCLSRLGRKEEAIAVYESCMSASSSDAQLAYNLALLYHESRRPEEALGVFARALERSLGDPSLLFARGRFRFVVLQDRTGGLEDMASSCQVRPVSYDRHSQTAWAAWSVGDVGKAVEILEAYLGEAPGDERALAYLASLRPELESQALEDALLAAEDPGRQALAQFDALWSESREVSPQRKAMSREEVFERFLHPEGFSFAEVIGLMEARGDVERDYVRGLLLTLMGSRHITWALNRWDSRKEEPGLDALAPILESFRQTLLQGQQSQTGCRIGHVGGQMVTLNPDGTILMSFRKRKGAWYLVYHSPVPPGASFTDADIAAEWLWLGLNTYCFASLVDHALRTEVDPQRLVEMIHYENARIDRSLIRYRR